MAYDPKGALNGLFAPAYIAGNKESDDAVQAWMVAHPRSPGVGTFVPDAAAAGTPPAQPPVEAQRNNIAAAVVSNVNPQFAAMRAQMSPQDIAIWQQAMTSAGRASEIPAFMNATFS